MFEVLTSLKIISDDLCDRNGLKSKVSTLEELKEKFLLVKQSQHTGELAMRDDRNCLADFLKALDRKNYTYTGMRDYAIIVLMLDTGIRTREPLNLHRL